LATGLHSPLRRPGRVVPAGVTVATHLTVDGRGRAVDQAGDPAQAEALGMTDLNGGAFFNAEFGIGHRGNTVPERSGVALSFCGRPPISLNHQGPGPYIVKVPKESCRSNFLGWHASENPFVKTILEGSKNHTESTLLKFHARHRYISIGELLQIKESPISSAPAMAAVMPWWNITPEERLKNVAILTSSGKYLGREAIEFGASRTEDYGWQYFGPTSPSIIEIEFKRQL